MPAAESPNYCFSPVSSYLAEVCLSLHPCFRSYIWVCWIYAVPLDFTLVNFPLCLVLFSGLFPSHCFSYSISLFQSLLFISQVGMHLIVLSTQWFFFGGPPFLIVEFFLCQLIPHNGWSFLKVGLILMAFILCAITTVVRIIINFWYSGATFEVLDCALSDISVLTTAIYFYWVTFRFIICVLMVL